MATVMCHFSTAADLPALFAIDQTIWNSQNSPGPFSIPDLAAYARTYPVGNQLVAELKGQAVGMISWNPLPPFESARYTWDIGIGVAANAQHHGVGQSLMQAVKLAAKQQGIHRIQLRVLSTNHQARQFYAQQGFQIESVAREAFYIDGQFVDDYGLAYLLD